MPAGRGRGRLGGRRRRGVPDTSWRSAERHGARRVARTPCTSRSPGSSPGASTGTAFTPARETSPVGRTRTRAERDWRTQPRASPSPRASTTSRATSPPTATWPQRRPRPRRPPRRLHLRVRRWGRDHVRKHSGRRADRRSTTTATATRCTRATRTCRRAHAALPVARHLGRPRGRERLRRRPLAGRSIRAERSCARRAAAYQAYYEHMPLPRCDACRAGRTCASTRRSRYGRLAASTCSTTASTASHQACPRRAAAARTPSLAELPRARGSDAHPARRGAGALARAQGSAASRGALEPGRPADADGAARPQARRRAAALDRRLGRLSASAQAPARHDRRRRRGEPGRHRRRRAHAFYVADLKARLRRPDLARRGDASSSAPRSPRRGRR